MTLRVTPLGAGRHVGRSSILVELGTSRVLLDCGINPGNHRTDHLPEFAALTSDGRDISQAIDAVFISHFHLDHIGALPYLTEVLGYRGPIYMTHPTKAIAPVLLDDYVRLSDPRRSGKLPYSLDMVTASLDRVSCFQLEERLTLGDLSVTPFYAGHVIGGVMLLLECGGRTALYTGDFTTVPDHQLRSAKVPQGLRPDVMITEATYGTTLRSSKRQKEQDLCRKIQDALEGGGKVLVPVSMVGKAQEFCLLCEKHWERAGLNFPIRIIGNLAERALAFFRLFSSWSSDYVRRAEEPFHFPHTGQGDVQSFLNSDTPMLAFAGTASLSGGPSLEIFKQLAPSKRNLVVFAGYSLPGTIGNEVLAKQKQVDVGSGQKIEVNCQVDYMSHSDHADARGVLQLLAHLAPRHVVLVHGQEGVLRTFRPIVQHRYCIPCSDPGTGQTVDLTAEPECSVLASPSLLRHARPLPGPPAVSEVPCTAFSALARKRPRGLELLDRSGRGGVAAGLRVHRLRYRHEVKAMPLSSVGEAWAGLAPHLSRLGGGGVWRPSTPPWEGTLVDKTQEWEVNLLTNSKLLLRQEDDEQGVVRVTIEWTQEDARHEEVANFLGRLGAL